MRSPGSLIFASFLLCSACGPVDPDEGANWADASSNADSNTNNNADAYVPPPMDDSCNKMDIVFVIDDSGSMAEEQSNLANNFPQFAQVLETYQTQSGELLDYRVAVTSTGRDLDYTLELPPPLGQTPFSEDGLNGAFRQVSGMTRRWIERSDGNLVSIFPQLASIGTGGPSYEMPLMMLDWAFNDRVADGTNQGFLRQDALLAIVVLTDEDDCSFEGNNFNVGLFEEPCSTFPLVDVPAALAMLDSVKNGRERWAVATIAGETSCMTALGDAAEATRLKDFVAQTGENGVFSSICQGDLSSPLADALATFDAACQSFPPIE